MSQERSKNEFAQWFGEYFEKLNVVTTFNLVYNAAIMFLERLRERFA
ncbi:hypothetical protein CE91St62_35580 [Lachnospiraceae bacterium]|nr:hypothetical protein CE91St61_35700 [Lachnospiraceae bacterium]BDF39497.1 hypothetical protein CE91St62_35580 [Lachnospiraceae bacterium]